MKFIGALFFGFLLTSSGHAQFVPDMIFIANDSVSSASHHYKSKLIIINRNGFIHPKSISTSIFQGNGNFAITEIEFFDTTKMKFIVPRLKMTEDVFPDFMSKNPNVRDTFLCESVSFLPVEVLNLNPGIYRARLKVLFSKYNPKIKDAYTNWSYFHIRG